jgi:VCBS repeat protein
MAIKKIWCRGFAAILGCALSLITPSAWANHRAGWYPLPEEIAVGDFNEDGNLDMAVTNTGFDTVAIFFGDGKGGFSLQGQLQADTLPKDIHTADLNGDRHLDLVETNEWGYDIMVYFGDGHGGFSPGQPIIVNGVAPDGSGAEPHGFAIGDFKENGHLGLVVGFDGPATISYYQGNASGQFVVPPVNYPQSVLVGPEYITAADLNHDNHLDVAAAELPNSLAVMLGDGTGSFTPQPLLTTNDRPASVVAGDFHNNGNLDLVVNGGEPHNATGLYLDPFQGDGLGFFTPETPVLFGSGFMQGTMAMGDFNEDGNADLAMGVNIGLMPTRVIWIFFGQGNGRFNPPQSVPVGIQPYAVAVADLNKDDHQDLLVSNRTNATVSVLLGDGKGNFTTSGTFSTVLP